MKTKHTPGPWKTIFQKHKTGRIDIGIISEPNEKRWIARICPEADINFEQEVADAHLIAAAPEMLEALKAMIDGHKNAWELLHAAIAKAEGRGE